MITKSVKDLFVKVKAEESRLKKALRRVGDRELKIVRGFLFKCRACGNERPLSEWTFIQMMHYISPFSCNGGAYWTPSSFDVCSVRCPVCGKENYIYNHPDKADLDFVVNKRGFALEDVFASVEVKERR